MAITYILLGATIWQTICLFIYAIMAEDEETTIYTAFGLWTPILMIAASIHGYICLSWLRRKYNQYQIYGNGANCTYPIDAYIATVYMTPKVAAKFRTVDKYGFNFAIRLSREGKDFKSLPLKQDVIKDRQKFPGMTEDFFKKFLETS